MRFWDYLTLSFSQFLISRPTTPTTTGAAGADGSDGAGGSSTLVYVSMGIGGVSLAGMIALLVIVLKKKKI